jgi:DNA-binding protein Fis
MVNENNKEATRVNNSKTEAKSSLHAAAEDILGQKLEDIATILSGPANGKSRLHEDVMTIVERCLFRIALRRCHDVKSRAADYLGLNRNTFQKKMVKLRLEE